jgi:prevent-host-death family protein
MNVATPPVVSEVGVRELKNHLSSYLQRVQAGEEVVVTEHGRPVARLTSLTPEVDHLAVLVAAGIVRRSSAPRRLPSRKVRVDGATVSDLVADQRR